MRWQAPVLRAGIVLAVAMKSSKVQLYTDKCRQGHMQQLSWAEIRVLGQLTGTKSPLSRAMLCCVDMQGASVLPEGQQYTAS